MFDSQPNAGSLPVGIHEQGGPLSPTCLQGVMGLGDRPQHTVLNLGLILGYAPEQC